MNWDRYNSLISRCSFNAEFFRGTWQDLSPAQRTMTPVGSPSFGKLAGWPCLKQNAAADGTTSAVVPAVVDLAGSWSAEAILIPGPGTTLNIITQLGAGNAGGFQIQWRNTGGDVNLLAVYQYDIAGVVRLFYTNIGAFVRYTPGHLLFSSINNGASAKFWINGIPAVANAFGAGVPANIGANRSIVVGTGAAIASFLFVRLLPFAFTNEDATACYQQAHILTSGEV